MSDSPNRGVTLVELLIAMTIAAVIGTALVSLLTSATRFEGRQEGVRDARRAGRSALNILTSDMRMVDPEWGIEAASSSSLTLRVSFAMGLSCSSSASSQTMLLFPVDSVILSLPGLSGYSTRASNGAMTANTTALTITQLGSIPGSCSSAGIQPISGSASAPNARSRPITLNGSGLAVVAPGTVVMLYKRIRYYFGPSAQPGVTGRTALWRDFLDDGVAAEELVAPFDASAAFRFYEGGSLVAQSTVPSSLSNTMGIETFLPGESDNIGRDRTTPEQSDMTTSVFFANRRL